MNRFTTHYPWSTEGTVGLVTSRRLPDIREAAQGLAALDDEAQTVFRNYLIARCWSEPHHVATTLRRGHRQTVEAGGLGLLLAGAFAATGDGGPKAMATALALAEYTVRLRKDGDVGLDRRGRHPAVGESHRRSAKHSPKAGRHPGRKRDGRQSLPWC